MTVRTLDRLFARLSNARHGNEAADYRDFLVSVFPPQFSGALVTKSANQTDVGAATVKVTWNTVDYDTDSYFDDANDRLIAPTAGYYVVQSTVRLDEMTGAARVSLHKNGVEYIRLSGNPDLGLGANWINGAAPLLLAATDYVEIFVTSPSAGGDIVGTLVNSFFAITRLGQAPA